MTLKAWRVGRGPAVAMRVIEAGATKVRQATSSPTPSAQATAALIGDTWVTTTTSRSAASSARSSQAARTRSPSVEQRLAAAGREGESARHAAQRSAGTSRSGVPSSVAVVELDPALVDLDGEAEGRRRLPGAPQRAATPRAAAAVAHRPARSACRSPSSSRPRVEAAAEERAPTRWPRSGRGGRRSARRSRDDVPPDAPGPEEEPPALRLVEAEAAASPTSRRPARPASSTSERAATQLGQLGRRPATCRGTATRTPRCRPRRRRARGAGACRSASPSSRRCTRRLPPGGEHHRAPAPARRR